MAMCYYCTNPGVTKRWVTTSRGGSGRLYIGKGGIRGGSISRGSSRAPRLMCAACAASHDRVEWATGVVVLAVIIAIIGFIIWADTHQPDYVDHVKYPIVRPDKDAK